MRDDTSIDAIQAASRTSTRSNSGQVFPIEDAAPRSSCERKPARVTSFHRRKAKARGAITPHTISLRKWLGARVGPKLTSGFPQREAARVEDSPKGGSEADGNPWPPRRRRESHRYLVAAFLERANFRPESAGRHLRLESRRSNPRYRGNRRARRSPGRFPEPRNPEARFGLALERGPPLRPETARDRGGNPRSSRGPKLTPRSRRRGLGVRSSKKSSSPK